MGLGLALHPAAGSSFPLHAPPPAHGWCRTPDAADFSLFLRAVDQPGPPGRDRRSRLPATLAEPAGGIRPILETYLQSLRNDALALLDHRVASRHVTSGIPAAWLAARREHPEMLLVADQLVALVLHRGGQDPSIRP